MSGTNCICHWWLWDLPWGCWWSSCWASQRRELLRSCSRIWACERLIWMCLLYLLSNFPQRCRNGTAVWISLPSAKCGQNWQASWIFNRVRTDKQHNHISLISLRIQASAEGFILQSCALKLCGTMWLVEMVFSGSFTVHMKAQHLNPIVCMCISM